jgi:hypothetical protein
VSFRRLFLARRSAGTPQSTNHTRTSGLPRVGEGAIAVLQQRLPIGQLWVLR